MKKFRLLLIFFGMMIFAQSVCFAEYECVVSYNGYDYYVNVDYCILKPDYYYGKVCDAPVRIEAADGSYEEWTIHFCNQRRMKVYSIYAVDVDGNARQKMSDPSPAWQWIQNGSPFFVVYQVAWMNAYDPIR